MLRESFAVGCFVTGGVADGEEEVGGGTGAELPQPIV